jgi:hypothetical protein
VTCASSTTVSVLPGKPDKPLYEVIVQGTKVIEVCECLKERYGFPLSSGKADAVGKKGMSVKSMVSKVGSSKFVEIINKT